MKTYKNVYEVVCKPMGNAFVGINFGEDGYTEFVDTNKDVNEVHSIFTDLDLDRQLDLSDGVVSFTVTDSFGN